MRGLKTYKVRRIHLEITGKCNLGCVYCYNSRFNNKKVIRDEMTTEQIKQLITEASVMGCKRFVFSGGEPFLRKDIFDIIEFCKGKDIEILTNGKKLSTNLIEKLSRYKQIKEIKVTLDGFKWHDKTRIGSKHKQVIKSLKELKKFGFYVVVNTEVTRRNLLEMPLLYQLIKEIKVDRWRVDLPFIVGRYIENYKDYSLPDFNKFISMFKGILINYLREKPAFEFELFNIYKSEITPSNLTEFDINIHPCSYRSGSFPLRPNGDMVFCPSFDLPMSNFVKEGSLKKAIKKKYQHEFYKLKIDDVIGCRNCKYLKLCGTGCRVDAYYYKGNYKEIDPIACSLMPLVEKEIIPILPKKLANSYKQLITRDLKNKK